MQYTPNYHLPQWVESDRIMMEDFNEMNSAIETGLTTANTNAAQAKEVAQAVAASKPYVVGSYTGSTTSPQAIHLGFRPAAVYVTGTKETGSVQAQPGFSDLLTGDNFPTRVQFTDTGFTVDRPLNNLDFPSFNDPNYTYHYIAFR